MANYIKLGGFPAIHLRSYAEDEAYTIVKDIYNSTIFSDIVKRNQLRKVDQQEAKTDKQTHIQTKAKNDGCRQRQGDRQRLIDTDRKTETDRLRDRERQTHTEREPTDIEIVMGRERVREKQGWGWCS